jgi:hypothetical protein
MLKGIQVRDREHRDLVLATHDNQPIRLPHIVLQALCCISLGVHRKVHIGRCLCKGGRRGFRRQQVPRMEYGLADGTEPRQDRCRDQVFLNNRPAT